MDEFGIYEKVTCLCWQFIFNSYTKNTYTVLSLIQLTLINTNVKLNNDMLIWFP